MMNSAVIYARQSFGAEQDSVSIDVQIDQCKAWAKRNGVEVKAVYSDCNTSSELYPACQEGIEASRIDKGFQVWQSEQLTKGRKQYKEGLGLAFDYIKANKPDAIIVYTRNRLGRTADNSYLDRFFNSFFIANHTSIVSVQDNSVIDFSDKLMSLLMQLKDSLDYQSVAEKRRASLESIARRIDSYKVISKAFAVKMENGTVTFDARQAEAVRYIFDGVCGGKAYSAILKALNADFIDCAPGKQFYMSNIYHIMDNLLYCGYARNKAGELGRAINIPQPIISFAQWQKVQEIRETKKQGSRKYNFKGQQKRHFLPLSGYLYCECGRRMQMNLDNGTCYHCKNEGGHTMRIRINGFKEDYDMHKSIQALFMVNAIASRKKLEAYSTISSKVDATKAEIEKAQRSLKAKFNMIESDEDYNLFKDEIAALKKQIETLKARLFAEEAELTQDTAELEAKIDTDFHNIMENELLEEDDYSRLLHETIEKITVFDDKVNIALKDGRAFDLPREIINRYGSKALPKAVIYAHSENDSLDGIKHYTIEYGKGENERVLLEDADLTILYRY